MLGVMCKSPSGVAWLLLALGLMLGAGSGLAEPVAEDGGRSGYGFVVDIEGAIGPAISSHVVKALTRAEEENASLVVLRMDTPGGLDMSMREIIKAILNSSVPVVGYVAPGGARAASAGTYILYASHVAAMAPATNLGAATPIPVAGPTPPVPPNPDKRPANDKAPTLPTGDAAQRKMINDAVAYIRSLAERRGRNADWAEQAVRGGASLSADQALKIKVIDLVAADMSSLLQKIDGFEVDLVGGKEKLLTADMRLETIEPDWRTELLAIITNPTVAYLLMMIGIYGLILEGYNPGGIVPGVAGAICLLLALFAFQILPVNYAGLALIVLGLALLMAEAFVPSFGILGLGGLTAFVFGSIMLMDTDVPGYQMPLALIAATATGGAALIGITVYLLMKARKHAVVSGSEALIGAHAEAVADFTANDEQGFDGQVWLAGEVWQATSHQALHKGQRLNVVSRDGLTVTVQPERNQGVER